MNRKLMTLAIVTIFTASILSGCGNSTTSESVDNTETIEETDTEEPGEAASDTEPESIEESEPEEIENEQEPILVQTESIRKDADGNITTSYVYQYNEKGEQIRCERTSIWEDITGTSIRTYIEEYEYDANGNKIKEISYYDGEDTPEKIIEYTYDEEGKQLSEKEYENDSIVSLIALTYDSDKNMIKKIFYDENNTLVLTREYTYDSDKNLIEEIGYDEDGAEYMKATYEYNDMGDIVSESFDYSDKLASIYGYTNSLDKYEYDDKNRLSLLTVYADDQLAFKVITEYDDNDNILKETTYDENESLEYTTEYKYMLLQDYLDNKENNITEQKTEENQSTDEEANKSEITEADTADTSGRKPITPEEIVFLYDGNTNLEKLYYRTSENASWTLFFDGIAEPGALISDSSGTITLYEGYFGVKLVFNNGTTENVHTINLVEGQVRNYDGSIGTTEYTGEMVVFIITDRSENFIDVDWS